MQFSSTLTLILSFSALTNAYTCSSWVLPEECLKLAAAFTLRMKTATFSMPKPAATSVDKGAAGAEPPKPVPHRNCGTLAIMDANDDPCDRMYRPQAVQPSPAPTTLATAVKRAAPS